jgi:hypothetical protein
MALYQNSFFRKSIVAWYDSDSACNATIAFLLPVLLFGLAGIYTAHNRAAYHDYLWVPVLLVALSAAVIVSTVIRMVRRFLRLPR